MIIFDVINASPEDATDNDVHYGGRHRRAVRTDGISEIIPWTIAGVLIVRRNDGDDLLVVGNLSETVDAINRT